MAEKTNNDSNNNSSSNKNNPAGNAKKEEEFDILKETKEFLENVNAKKEEWEGKFKVHKDYICGLCDAVRSLRDDVNKNYFESVIVELEERVLKYERIDQEEHLLERFRKIGTKRMFYTEALKPLQTIKCKKWASAKDIAADKIYDSTAVIRRFNELREGTLEMVVCIREHYYLMNKMQDRVDENQYVNDMLNVDEVYSVPVLLEIRGADTETINSLADRLMACYDNFEQVVDVQCVGYLTMCKNQNKEDLANLERRIRQQLNEVKEKHYIENEKDFIQKIGTGMKEYGKEVAKANKEMAKLYAQFNSKIKDQGVDKQVLDPFKVDEAVKGNVVDVTDDIIKISTLYAKYDASLKKKYESDKDWDVEFMKMLKEMEAAKSHTLSNIGWSLVAAVAMFCIGVLAIPFENITRLFLSKFGE